MHTIEAGGLLKETFGASNCVRRGVPIRIAWRVECLCLFFLQSIHLCGLGVGRTIRILSELVLVDPFASYSSGSSFFRGEKREE